MVAVHELTQWGRGVDSAYVWALYAEAATIRYRSPASMASRVRSTPRLWMRTARPVYSRRTCSTDFLIRPVPARAVTSGPVTGNAIQLSRVGANAARDSALVHIAIICKGLCGRSEIALYVRRDGTWAKAGQLMFAHH